MQNANGKKNEATFLVTHRMEKSIFKDYKLMRKWSDRSEGSPCLKFANI